MFFSLPYKLRLLPGFDVYSAVPLGHAASWTKGLSFTLEICLASLAPQSAELLFEEYPVLLIGVPNPRGCGCAFFSFLGLDEL